jgi:hypothetical protein
MIKPSDFPRGFAETPGCIDQEFQLPLAYGEMFDAGIKYYGEFFVNLEFGWELLHGGMTSVDGRPGKLAVACRFKNAVQLKWRFDGE